MTPTILFYKHKINADGTSPVIIQIIANRKVFKKTLFNLKSKDWDSRYNRVKSSHMLHLHYNDLISTRLNDVEINVIKRLKENKPITKEVLDATERDGKTISKAIAEYMEYMKANGHRTHYRYKQLSDKITANRMDVLISEADYNWLDKVHKYLLTINKHNTAAKAVHMVQSVLRHQMNNNNFNDMKVFGYKAGYKATTKDKLTKDELHKIINLALPDGLIQVVRDSFLMAFYMRGMRIGDVLTLLKTEVRDGRIIREARKTEKPINMAIVPAAQEIIERYKDRRGIYVLPLMKMESDFDSTRYYKHIEAKTTVVNKYLKIIAGMADIEKTITSHVARHTFAYLADQSGMTGKRIQDLLDHSDLKTTEIYLTDLRRNDVLDAAMSEFIKGII